jgi:cytochrome c peroxidase
MLWAAAGVALFLFMQAPLARAVLNPPTPYVLDAGTELTLEQAGILKPDGRMWGRVLGKALFWDQQVGSDGTACASCHSNAGADTRLKNQINPGFNDITKGANGDTTFGSERSDTLGVAPGMMPSGAPAGPNYTLTPADLPLHQLENETNRNSPIRTTTNDRISSQGAFDATFGRVKILGQPDKCTLEGEIFHAGPYAARQVEPRNTPTTVNAVFFHRNFWDGRANNLFNGVGVFGMRDVHPITGDPNKRLIVLDPTNQPQLGYLRVENASLASQAVGPPLSDLEMSCGGRSFPAVGRKLLFTIPLFQQKVDKSDSVLGPYVGPLGRGLKLQYRYAELIRKTFDPKYWAAPGRYKIENGQLVSDPKGYTQMEINFSMFWGLSIMLYESTLVSDQSEFDSRQTDGRLVMNPRFGPPTGGCTTSSLPTPGSDEELLLRGCTIFARANNGNFATNKNATDNLRGGGCFTCHISVGGGQVGGVARFPEPMLAENTFQAGEAFPIFLPVGDVSVPPKRALRDQGFAGLGLRPAFTDQMSGKTDPYGNPLSFGGQLWNHLDGLPNAVLDPPVQRAIAAGTAPARVPGGGGGTFAKLEVDGSSKAPILRNVALTPPYFSWGGYPSIRQVLKVYNRGMNRRDITATNSAAESPAGAGTACTSGDNSGSGPDGKTPLAQLGPDCGTNTTGAIVALGLADCEAPAGTAPGDECIARGLTVANDDLAALERFMKSLTDRRVQCDVAPFDHPELKVTNGHYASDQNHDGKATDISFSLPAVGASGYAPASGFCVPNSGDLFAPGMQARFGGARVPLAP